MEDMMAIIEAAIAAYPGPPWLQWLLFVATTTAAASAGMRVANIGVAGFHQSLQRRLNWRRTNWAQAPSAGANSPLSPLHLVTAAGAPKGKTAP